MITITCDRCKKQGYWRGIGVFLKYMSVDLHEPEQKHFRRPFIGHLCSDCQEGFEKMLDSATKGFVKNPNEMITFTNPATDEMIRKDALQATVLGAFSAERLSKMQGGTVPSSVADVATVLSEGQKS